MSCLHLCPCFSFLPQRFKVGTARTEGKEGKRHETKTSAGHEECSWPDVFKDSQKVNRSLILGCGDPESWENFGALKVEQTALQLSWWQLARNHGKH